MFTWSEVGMFFAGALFGTWFWWKQIVNGLRYEEMGKQQVRNQLARQSHEKKELFRQVTEAFENGAFGEQV